MESYARRLVRTGTKCHKVKTHNVQPGARDSLHFFSMENFKDYRDTRKKKREGLLDDYVAHRCNEFVFIVDTFLHVAQ